MELGRITAISLKEKNGNRNIFFPWNPETIKYESNGTVRVTYDILNRGPVEIPTGSGLKKYSWEGIFPGKNRDIPSMNVGQWADYEPKYYRGIIDDWRKKGTVLKFLGIGLPFNLDVIIDDYDDEASGAFGDFTYKISLLEWRDIVIQSTVIEEPAPKRTETQSSGKTYTVKSGDCLWSIAVSQLKDGTRGPEIYQLNKEIMESTAKKNGRKSSNNGWWIYAGTVLTLP